MATNTPQSSNSNRILEIYDPNWEDQSDSDDMVNVREVTAEHRQELAQVRQAHQVLTAEHRQELAQVRQELTAEHRQEIAHVRQELTAEHRQELAHVRQELTAEHRQEIAQARQELTTAYTKVATLEERLIHKIASNEELKNVSLSLLRGGCGRLAQASGIQIQARDAQTCMYVVSAGLVLFLLAYFLLGKN
ncbi:hypothetical protein BGAL_0451g00060 [Botrytis galanthina]|uniref:Uncharacterized protein n=1 Tax=Botrytis galanthina TaxID=278940 RepID=A0A4S8QNX7_9HELO|nr:hypothetical protein BGAL_0451g00060 [Botrytis galanthina]